MRAFVVASGGLLCACVAAGCQGSEREEEMALPTSITATITAGGTDSDGSGNDGNDGNDTEKLDVGGGGTGTLPCEEGDVCDECVIAEHTPCDQGTTDLFAAMGLNCPGEAQMTVSTMGSLQAMGIRSGFGTTNEWTPREGSVFAVLGSGFVADLDMETPQYDLDVGPTHCNDDLGAEYDIGTLPAPLRANDVGGDCSMDPSLLGTGDCSNTIQEQFEQGGGAFDYTEVRLEATVPPSNNSLSYDFAFFSTEYPYYYGSGFNDMYVGWLESESWTGNISFDEQGNPISLNAGFLDFRDDGGNLPELDGTCMRQHAGTKWLNTTAPVTPGEQITVVLAIFDLSDPILDSYVFLDNFGWGCEGEDKPTTKPVG